MSSSNDSRYDAILRRIAQRKGAEANASQQDALAAVLDAVNAWGFLEAITKAKLKPMNCYGPASFRGCAPTAWVGVVIWCKPRGYYHYRTLTLLGIWACDVASQPQITLGAKPLEFSAPIFNPESYYHHIKRRFDLYYQDSGGPPPDNMHLLTIRYDPSKRLEIREAIRWTLAQWAEAYRS